MRFNDFLNSSLSIILKEDYSNHFGIADYLTSSNGPANELANSKATSDNSILISNVMSKCYSNGVYAQNVNPGDVCKNINVTINDVKKNISSSLTANFDELSAMVVNAFLPLTNIRKSNFTFLKLIDGSYGLETVEGIAFLTDNAILSVNNNQYANNKNSASRIVFNGTSILSVNSSNNRTLRDNISSLKEEVVLDSFNSNKNSNLISSSTVDSLVNYCIATVNHIITAYPCQFNDDYNSLSNQIYVTYHNDSNTRQFHSYKYNTYEVQSLSELGWIIDGFAGWSTNEDSSLRILEYKPGDEILLLENIDLYPVLKEQYTVTYKFDNYNFLSIDTREDSVFEGDSYEILSFSSFNDGGDEVFKGNFHDFYDYYNNKSQISAEFLFWSTNPNEDPLVKNNGPHSDPNVWYTNYFYTYKNANRITTFSGNSKIKITGNITLYPVFKVIKVNIKNPYTFYAFVPILSNRDGDFYSGLKYENDPDNYENFEYLWTASRFWTDIGLAFNVILEWRHLVFSSITYNGSLVEVSAEDATVTVNPGDSTITDLHNKLNGFKFNTFNVGFYRYGNDGQASRLYQTWAYGSFASFYNRTLLWQNEKENPKTINVTDAYKYMGAWILDNWNLMTSIYDGVQNPSGLWWRSGTDWVDENNSVHVRFQVKEIDAEVRVSPRHPAFHDQSYI